MLDFEFYSAVAIKLIMGFILVLILFQFSGAKRQLTQITTIDLISNFILGGIISGFIYNSDISLMKFSVVVCTYFVIITIIYRLRDKTIWGRKMVVGVPTVIISSGIIDQEKLKKAHISMTDLMSLLRKKDIHSLTEIKLAQIEVGGELTVVKKGDDYYALLLVDNGVINQDNLAQINKDEKWLMRELKKKGIKDVKEVFAAQWLEGKFYLITC